MEYWYLFPLGVVVATVAMSSGVAGSNFWIPIYFLGLRLEPRLAFWVSLLTMLLGSGSGVLRNWQAGTIDGRLLRSVLTIAAPITALSALLSTQLPLRWLLLLFAAFSLAYGFVLLLQPAARATACPKTKSQPETLTSALPATAALAGFFHGAVATGAGALLLPLLLQRRRENSPATAIGTSVTMLFVCSLVSASFRLDGPLLETVRHETLPILGIMAFAGPGVLLGGQLGPRLARKLPRRVLRRYLGAILVLVGCLVGLRGLS